MKTYMPSFAYHIVPLLAIFSKSGRIFTSCAFMSWERTRPGDPPRKDLQTAECKWQVL